MSLIHYTPGGGRATVGSGKGSFVIVNTPSNYIPVGIIRGNTLIVDQVYGNDATASVGGTPYLTVNAAVSAVTTGQTVYILPGTYNLTGGILIPTGVSIRGMSLQTCIVQMLNVTADTTLVTMGSQTRIEDLTLKLTSQQHRTLKGIVFGGTTTASAKLRTCVLTVDNSGASVGGTSVVTGIECNGTGALSSSSFSFNSLKGSTINVLSNGGGNKRGVLVSNANVVTTRDLNVYVAQPTNTASTGSYVGVETNDTTGPDLGSIQLRSTTVGITFPTGTQAYTASDILQTTPASITDPTYLASAGIQVGPGTDLVTKSAGTKGFSTYIYPTTVYYGLRGNITSAGSGGYLWPGTQTVSAGQYPDTGLPAAYYRIQQPALLSGMSASLNIAPGGTNTLTLSVYYTPANSINGTATQGIVGYISGTTLNVVSGPTLGSIAIGQSVSGPGVGLNTYIVSGSGSTWTVFPSQTAGSVGSPINMSTGVPNSSFTGTISGTALTVSSVTGVIAIGQYVAGAGVTTGTTIVSGSGSSWVVSPSQTVSSPTAMSTTGMLSTPFTVTFTGTEITKSFYNASTRLNTSDRISLYSSYTSGSPANGAHDITCQLDFF
jgi:hypothetical protein